MVRGGIIFSREASASTIRPDKNLPKKLSDNDFTEQARGRNSRGPVVENLIQHFCFVA